MHAISNTCKVRTSLIMLSFMLMVGILMLSDSNLQTVAQEVCTRLSPNTGSNIQTQFLNNSRNVDTRYYLNTAEPAQCSGIILSVDYCYYGPSQYSNNLAWSAGMALYRSQADGSYRRVSGVITLSKRAPSNQLSSNPKTDLLLNFNCDTYALNSIVHVQEGDVFGALVLQDQEIPFTGVAGLDLLGDSSCGYQMMTRTSNTIRIDRSSDRRILGLRMIDTLTGLSLDTRRRVLHVFADIIPYRQVIIPNRPSVKPTACEELITTTFMNLILSPNRTTILNFVKPVTVISPSRPPVKQTTPPESITTTVILSPYSTHSQTTTVTITTENTSQTYMYTTESSTQPQPIEVESLRPQIKIIGGVLGAVVIILGILIIIVTVVVILRKKGRKASFDLTTNEAYTDRIIQCHARLIDEGDNEAIEHGTADLSKVPLEQNAAYMVKSPIVAARNVAYENTSEFSEYDYILNAQ